MRILVVVALVALVACGSENPAPARDQVETEPQRPPDPYKAERERMVERTIAARGVTDERVLEALRSVPRHELVPRDVRDHAYADRPLPIGHDKTISQPYIVAVMTEAARLQPGDKVLEIGTGSGYQAAVLAELGNRVYTIEIVEPLAKRARRDLERLGYPEVRVREGDGMRGWPEVAPFDAIIVTAAGSRVPRTLVEQLEIGGRLVMPIGEDDDEQYLSVITRLPGDYEFSVQRLMPVRFGRLLGDAQDE